MPTEQPSNAPDDLHPRDEASVAAVLADDSPDRTPGGGGLGGAQASGHSASVAGTASNAPIDVAVPPDVTDAGTTPSTEAQARREATDTSAADQHPASR